MITLDFAPGYPGGNDVISGIAIIKIKKYIIIT